MYHPFIQFDPTHPVLSFAADELERHLAMLPEAALSGPVQLIVCDSLSDHGFAPPQTNEDDQYAFAVTAEGGSIRGVNPRSVLLGVYAYLHAIGFRFIRPGRDGTVVPTGCGNEQLTAKDACCAFVRHRGVCIEGSESVENVLDFIDWLPKVGYNSFFMQFKTPYTFLQRYYHHVNNPLHAAEELTDEFVAKADRDITAAMQLRGILHQRVGHGWTTDAMGLSNLGGWYQCDAPAPVHIQPLLAEINGKRDYFGGVPTNTNLCYSNPEARSRFVKAVADYSSDHPEVSLLHVWLADYFNNVCECPECAKTTPSDQYVEMMNELDGELTARGLATRIVFLIYQELLYAPEKARLHNPDRFVLMFAPISRTFRESYPVNFTEEPLPPYVRNQFQMPTRVEENLTCLRRWQQVFDGDSFDYDYHLGRAHYGDFGYVGISRVIAQDVRSLPAMGLNGMVACQELRVLCPSALPSYVMGRMLMDSRVSFEQLFCEYFDTAYGPQDGPMVRSYLETLSELSDCDYFNAKGPRVNPQYEKALGEILHHLQSMASVLDEKSKATGSYHWKLLAYHNAYSTLLAEALQWMCRGEMEQANAAFTRFNRYISAHEEQFQPDLDVYRISEIGVNHTGFTLPY